jgi:protein SCO1
MKATGAVLARVFYVTLIVLVSGVIAFAVFRPITVLPRSTVAPGFAFFDAEGHPVNNESLRGQLVLYHFSAANCDDSCTAANAAMREVQRRLSTLEVEPRVTLVTIAVDGFSDASARDIAALDATAQQLGAQPGTWRVLGGDTRSIKRVVGGGFRVFYEAKDGATRMEPGLFLVDGWGIRRAEYRSPAPDPDVIERDLRLLATEARNSKGLARYAYEAAHLFLCYPI